MSEQTPGVAATGTVCQIYITGFSAGMNTPATAGTWDLFGVSLPWNATPRR